MTADHTENIKLKAEMFDVLFSDGMQLELIETSKDTGIDVYTFHLSWTPSNAEEDDAFTFHWCVPMTGIMYTFYPKCGIKHSIDPDWSGAVSHMISSGAPLNCYFDGQSKNKYTVAISEAQMLTQVKNGIVEENGCLKLQYSIGVKQFTNRYETTFSIRIDTREIPVYQAVADAAAWWEKHGITPACVPAAAKEPCYSFWYSFHQNINEREVEEECKRARELGFSVCIVDDGWQTSDANRGYAYCGDWEPCKEKFPDMAAHVKRVHDIGMKYILWYSVPFVGTYTKAYHRFQDMFLRATGRENEYILDPRYKEVRDYLIGKYKAALLDWNLDGFKLDFIDTWRDDKKNAPVDEKMDIPSLQDAVNVFMTSVTSELTKIKPDILIEFRQNYIGPHMRRFGNMFRVADCPGDYIKNRVGVLDLRMLMGKSAVHSDMLMWHESERAEKNALQMISILFGVMQYSAKLDRLTEETRRMSRFWLDFMKEKKEILLDGELRSYDPHLNYTWAESVTEEENIAAVYAENRCITPEKKRKMYLANGTTENRVILELSGTFDITIKNCCGEALTKETRTLSGISVLPIPEGGLAELIAAPSSNSKKTG